MELEWVIVGILWGIIIVAVALILISDMKKTPEQRKAEVEEMREGLKRSREEEKRRRQQRLEEMSEKGCAQKMFEFTLASIFLMISIIIAIMVIIS